MKDKKMIEEMAKDIYKSCAWKFGRPNDYKDVFAEDMYNLGYRKIDKDSVVLSKEEYEKLCKEKNNYKQRFESSEKRYEQSVQSGCEALEKKSKKTAEKILRELKHSEFKFSVEINKSSKEDVSKVLEEFRKSIFGKIKEIATREGVEIKEN